MGAAEVLGAVGLAKRARKGQGKVIVIKRLRRKTKEMME